MDAEESHVSFSAIGCTRFSNANTSAMNRSLNAKASRMRPKEYAKARARFPSPEC